MENFVVHNMVKKIHYFGVRYYLPCCHFSLFLQFVWSLFLGAPHHIAPCLFMFIASHCCYSRNLIIPLYIVVHCKNGKKKKKNNGKEMQEFGGKEIMDNTQKTPSSTYIFLNCSLHLNININNPLFHELKHNTQH
jgi:hypothetical protein